MRNELSRRDLLIKLGAGVGMALTGGALHAQTRAMARVGSREILTLSDGAVTLPAGMIARDRPGDELSAALRAGGYPADMNRMPLNVTVIRDGEQLTLIDCGAGGRFLEGSGKLASAFEQAGFDKDKVTRVLFTHAHADHFWGSMDEFDELLFPNASWAMPSAERDFWLADDVLQKVPESFHMMVAGAQRVIKLFGDKLATFRAGQEVAPGIAALDTRGHTLGHVSFEVRSGSESFVVLGDALTHPLISFAYPRWMPVSDQDGEQAIATRLKLLDRLSSEKIAFTGYHLPGSGMGRAERGNGAYRLVPV